MLNHTIEKLVDENIDNIMGSKPAIRDWLKGHERKHILIERLTMAIKETDIRSPGLVDRGVIQLLAKEFTNLFCRTAIETREVELSKNRRLEDNLVLDATTDDDNLD